MALVIELKYNKSAENALQQALDYKFIFEKWHLFVKTIKYIGINVTKEKKVNILIELKMNKQQFFISKHISQLYFIIYVINMI